VEKNFAAGIDEHRRVNGMFTRTLHETCADVGSVLPRRRPLPPAGITAGNPARARPRRTVFPAEVQRLRQHDHRAPAFAACAMNSPARRRFSAGRPPSTRI